MSGLTYYDIFCALNNRQSNSDTSLTANMDYARKTISPALSQASCGSPNYESEFTSNGSPGQCSVMSDTSLSSAQMSPGALRDTYSLFRGTYGEQTTNSGLQFQSHDAIDSKADALLSNALGASPSTYHSHGVTDSFGCADPNMPFVRPSTTVDVNATATPYSDATKPKKQAKEGRIKRPMNAFMVWSQQARKAMIAEKPELHNADISKDLGQRWRKMTTDEKAPWIEEAAKLKELHLSEFPGYKYKPRKNKNKVQKKPVKTESGRVSKPTGKNRQPTSSSKQPAKAPRNRGGGKPRAKKASAAATTAAAASSSAAATAATGTGTSAEVNSSLVSMLQAGPQPRFQPIGVTTFQGATAEPKQFNRVVIDDAFRKGVRESQKVPSSTEITPPAQTGDHNMQVDFPTTTTFHNPAFRPADTYYSPTPSPVDTTIVTSTTSPAPSVPFSTPSSVTTGGFYTVEPSTVSTVVASPSTSSSSSQSVTATASVYAAETMGLSDADVLDDSELDSLLLDQPDIASPAVTPSAVVQVGDSIVFSQYPSGASATYNKDTNKTQFNNLAPLKSIPDLSNLSSALCLNALDIEPTISDEIVDRNFADGDYSWDGFIMLDLNASDRDFTMKEDLAYVTASESLPDTIFAETPGSSYSDFA